MKNLTYQLENYLKVRRSFGFDLSTSARILRKFIAFANEQKSDHITTDLFLRWKNDFGNAGNQTWAARLGVVRQFAQWLSGIDARNVIPPKGLIPGRQRRPHPYIYSKQEIQEIINGAIHLHSFNGIRELTYSTLFALIAITGLRVSEAIALDNNDVDLINGVLTIRQGKNGKERIVPILKSAAKNLLLYTKERDRLLGHSPQPFFVSDTGHRLTDCAARYNFAMVCQNIGLRSPQHYSKHGRGPRIHDLRHTFAAQTMVNWYRGNKNPDREMIKLSTYLGHNRPEFTYWYIEAVPELLNLASQRVTRSLKREGKK